MKNFSLRTYVPLLATLAIIFMPLIGLAQQANYIPPPPPATYIPPVVTLINPLSVNNFCDLLKIVLDAILLIGMPIAVLFLVYVGFSFIVARGKPEAIGKAQKNFLYTVIGIAIFLGAWTIAKVIQSVLVGLGATAAQQC